MGWSELTKNYLLKNLRVFLGFEVLTVVERAVGGDGGGCSSSPSRPLVSKSNDTSKTRKRLYTSRREKHVHLS